MSQNFDDAFNKKYEEALEGLSDEQVSQVAKLNHSRLMEWVNSPARIRPFLLLQWSTDGKKQDDSIPSSNKSSDQSSPRQFVKDKKKEPNRLLRAAISVSDFLKKGDLLLEIGPLTLFFFSIILLGIYVGNYVAGFLGPDSHLGEARIWRVLIILGACILSYSVCKEAKDDFDFKPFTALFSVVGLLAGLFIGISGGDYGVLVLPGYYVELGPHLLGSSVGCIIGMFFGFLIDMALDYWQE